MKFLVGLFLLTAFPAFAQDSAQYRACSRESKTQLQMNSCASEEAARTDAALNQIYRRVLARAGKQEGAASRIKAAERAWIVYRDAYIDAMYPAKNKQAEYGSTYPTEADLLRAKLTNRQVTALKELLQHYGDDEHSGSNKTVDPKSGNVQVRSEQRLISAVIGKADLAEHQKYLISYGAFALEVILDELMFLDERYEYLRLQHEAAKYRFEVMELDLAITYLEIARSAGHKTKSKRNEEHANVALSTARRFLDQASLSEQMSTEIVHRLWRVASLRDQLKK